MKRLSLAVVLLMMCGLLNSCVKDNFDTPPDTSAVDPKLPVNLTIAQLSHIANTMATGQYRTLGDSTIYGIVTADDRSGNFYKQIVIQDSTGGITISISQTYLYTDYPIGRKIYVKLKGLTIINYKGLPEVGLSAGIVSGNVSLTGIPSALTGTYIVKASYPNIVHPDTVRLIDVISNENKYLNKLVTITNMEFDSTAVGQTYAGSVSSGAVATNRTVRDCPTLGGTMIMYNSAYASFQPAVIPGGKGYITGIFSVYTSPQFLIRDTSDIQLTGPRDCK